MGKGAPAPDPTEAEEYAIRMLMETLQVTRATAKKYVAQAKALPPGFFES